MELFNQFKDNLTNLFSKKQPTAVSLNAKINEMSLSRTRQSLNDLRSALQAAESVHNPTRHLLVNVYENILLDAHLNSVIQNRKFKVTSKSFQLVNQKGKEDLAKTRLFQSSWFYQFMDLALDSQYYGHSLIQLGDIVDGKFSEIKIVNRSHVKPEFGIVVGTPWESEGDSFESGEFAKWYIPVCKNKKDLGLLSKVAALLLFKNMALGAFAQYTELFGVPIRTGFVASNSEESKKAMVNMLKNMGQAAWGLFEKEDKVEIIESTGKSGEVFEQFLNYVDASISKAIVGQTMTTDSGSSYSQANVHQNIFNTIIEADARFIEFTVNDLLLPRMAALGFPVAGFSFKFDNEEYVSIKEKFDMVKGLVETGRYEVPESYILDKFGIPVKMVNTSPSPSPEENNGDSTGKKLPPL